MISWESYLETPKQLASVMVNAVRHRVNTHIVFCVSVVGLVCVMVLQICINFVANIGIRIRSVMYPASLRVIFRAKFWYRFRDGTRFVVH